MTKKDEAQLSVFEKKKELKKGRIVVILFYLIVASFTIFIALMDPNSGLVDDESKLLLLFFVLVPGVFVLWFLRDRKRDLLFHDYLLSTIEKKPEEELAKKWTNEAQIPLIKARNFEYLLPGQKGYNELEATNYFTTEAEALVKYHFPKKN